MDYGYYPWHFGVMDLLDLGLEALLLWDIEAFEACGFPLCINVTLLKFLSEVLEVYFKALVCIVYVQVLLWTQKKFNLCKDLAQALEFLIGFVLCDPLVALCLKVQRMGIHVD